MANDLLEKLLHEVALGKINVKDAKKALEGIDLEKDDFQKAVDFGVFTEAEPGTVIKATISPSGGSALVSLIFLGYFLDYLLVWNIHVWTNERMGSATIILPHIHHNYHINNNWNCLSKMGFTRFDCCKT